MEAFLCLLKTPFVRRIMVLVFLCIIISFLQGQITLLLLTFILVFLVDSAQLRITRLLRRLIPVNSKVVVVCLYLIMGGLLFLFLYIYVPEIISQITNIVQSVTDFIINFREEVKSDNFILNYLYDYLQKLDIENYVKDNSASILGFVGNLSSVVVNIIISMVLSLFFLLEKERILIFLSGFQNSKLSWVYEELRYFGIKFANSFGKVIKTQIVIAFINAVISAVLLTFLKFPNVVGLFIMIFVLGLIPVAGVIISLIPLSIIAYSIGGMDYIIYIIILIVILHMLESYILNPKLMSHSTKLPVFITFLVLILSEHLMGIWGLIVGIPITMFILDIFEVKWKT